MPRMGKRSWPGLERSLEFQMQHGVRHVPVLHLKFGEGSGSEAKDSSPQGNDGDIEGATWVDGWIGPGLSFDGENDYVEVPHDDSIAFTSENFSVLFWCKFTKDDVFHWLFGKGLWDVDGWECYRSTTEAISFYTYQSGAHQVTTSNVIEKDVWMHIAIVRNGSTVTIYRDGEDITDVHGSHADPASSTRTLRIGIAQDKVTGPTCGNLDEIRFYNRALTALEVRALYYGIE